jgi:hypothetical protein
MSGSHEEARRQMMLSFSYDINYNLGKNTYKDAQHMTFDTNYYYSGSTRTSSMFIAQVATSKLMQYCLSIQFLNDYIDINGWIYPGTKTLFFPMQEIGSKFSIDFRFI